MKINWQGFKFILNMFIFTMFSSKIGVSFHEINIDLLDGLQRTFETFF